MVGKTLDFVSSATTAKHLAMAETQNIQPYFYWDIGVRFCLVDTPGFDDTHVSDVEILEKVSKWLINTYRKEIKISAVLYVHNISQPRMQGSALRSFRVFRKLCGENYSSRIILFTTFHDIYQKSPRIIASRLTELKKDEFFGPLIAEGAKLWRAPRTQDDGRSLIWDITELEPIALKIQEEVVDQNISLEETLAMKTMFELELERQRGEFEQKMKEAKEDFARQMREMEERRAEELKVLRKEFEGREKAPPVSRRAQSEQLDSRPKVEKSEAKPGPPPRRAQTTSDLEFQQMSAQRQRQWQGFNKAIQSCFNVLMTGKQNGHVKCSMAIPVKSYYSTICRHCLRTIGQFEWFRE